MKYLSTLCWVIVDMTFFVVAVKMTDLKNLNYIVLNTRLFYQPVMTATIFPNFAQLISTDSIKITFNKLFPTNDMLTKHSHHNLGLLEQHVLIIIGALGCLNLKLITF